MKVQVLKRDLEEAGLEVGRGFGVLTRRVGFRGWGEVKV